MEKVISMWTAAKETRRGQDIGIRVEVCLGIAIDTRKLYSEMFRQGTGDTHVPCMLGLYTVFLVSFGLVQFYLVPFRFIGFVSLVAFRVGSIHVVSLRAVSVPSRFVS